MSYYRLATSRAFAQTTAFWNVHQVWKYASVTISAVALRLLVKRWSPVMGWEGFLEEAAVFLVFGFIVTWTGTFLINLIRVPAILHAEQEVEIARLTKIAYPEVSEEESRRREIVTGKIKDLSRRQKEVLRHIMDYGGISSAKLKLSGRFDADDIYLAFSCVAQSEAFSWYGDDLTVKPEFKSALNSALKLEGL
jgi:hypothetical protein